MRTNHSRGVQLTHRENPASISGSESQISLKIISVTWETHSSPWGRGWTSAGSGREVLCLVVGCYGLVMMQALPVEESPGKPSHGERVLNHCVIAPSAGDEEQPSTEHRLDNPVSGAPTASALKLFTRGTRHNSSPSPSPPCRALQQAGTPAKTHSWLVSPGSWITRATGGHGGLCPAGLCCHHCSTSFIALSQLQILSE